MRNDPGDSLARSLAGPHGGVYVAFIVCAVLASLAYKAHFRKAERAFRERGEVLPIFPFQPTPLFRATADATGRPRPPERLGETNATEPHPSVAGRMRLAETVEDLIRGLKNGASR